MATSQQQSNLCNRLDSVKISDDPRAKLRSWLGKILKVVITDERIIVGCFVCTDRDANVILENSWEYTKVMEGKYPVTMKLKPQSSYMN